MAGDVGAHTGTSHHPHGADATGSWNTQLKEGQRRQDPTPGLVLFPKPAQQLQVAWPGCSYRPFVGLRTMCLSPGQGLQAGCN